MANEQADNLDEESVETATETTDTIQQALSDLETVLDNQKAILSATTETDQGIGEIPKATDDQVASIAEIASMTDDIAHRATEVSAAIDELSEANETQHQMARDPEETVAWVDQQPCGIMA